MTDPATSRVAAGGTWRLLWRSTALALATAISIGILLIAGPLARLHVADLRRWRAAVFRCWARLTARVLGMQIEVVGRRPPAPSFLISNHLSYVDIVVLATEMPAAFVAKREVAGWPVIGTACRVAGTLFVDRASRRDVLRVNRQISDALAAGYDVILFPEGTSTRGATVAPFRPSLLAPAAEQGLPLFCASLSYRTPPGSSSAEQAVCWWGDMELGPHLLNLLRLPRFEARICFSAEPLRRDERKALALDSHDRVSAMFVPVQSWTAESAAVHP